MAKTWIVLDASGKVYGIHTWGGAEPPDHCPIAAPEGGQSMVLDDAAALINLIKAGQEVTVVSDKLMVSGAHVGTIINGKVVLLS